MWRWTALVVALAVCENSAPLGALAAEAPHSAVDQCDPQSLRVGIRFDGVPMLSMNKTETPVECCQLCAAEIRCKGFTWQNDTDATMLCKLKTAVPRNPSKMAGHVSGACHQVPTPPAPPSPTPPPPPPPTPPPPTPPPAPQPKQPHIVFVLTDDQDGWLNGYDPVDGVKHMDQLDSRVRKNGMLFTNYYLAYPLCSPSRSAILTGRFPHNTNFTTNADLNSSTFHPVQESHTVNNWLHAAGYETMLCGKYMNGYHGSNGHWATYIPAGWTDWFGFQTVDFFGTQVNINGVSTKYPQTAYQTDIIANLSINWLRNTHDRSKPMFMMLTPHAPHEPYTPAPRHLGTLKGLVQPYDPAFNMPDALQKLLPGNLGRLPNVSVDSMNSIFELRAESLLAIDEMIGGVLDELEAQGALSNTYFFFTCDNGYHLGQHRMPPGKREIFEHDINVPLIVMGPKIAPGSVARGMVQNIDFAHTWASIAGAATPPDAPITDGKSFAAVLFGQQEGVRNYSLQEGYQSCEAGHGEGGACAHKLPPAGSPWGARFAEVPPRGVKWPAAGRDYSGLRLQTKAFPDAMYVEYTDGGKAFFNSSGDPWQTVNIYPNLPSFVQDELAKMLASVVDCGGEQCP